MGAKYYPGSRHQFGDALDIGTNASTLQGFHDAAKQVGGACVEPVAVQGGSYAHCHADWRTQATVGPTVGSACKPGW